MTSDDLTVPLTHVPIFNRLTAQQIELLADTAERVLFRRGQPIIRSKVQGDTAYLIIKGEASAFHEDLLGNNGDPLPEGTFIGELAMLTEIRHSTTIIAKTDVRAVKFSRSVMQDLMRQDPDLAAHFVEILRSRMMGFATRLREIDRELSRDLVDTGRAAPAAQSTHEISVR